MDRRCVIGGLSPLKKFKRRGYDVLARKDCARCCRRFEPHHRDRRGRGRRERGSLGNFLLNCVGGANRFRGHEMCVSSAPAFGTRITGTVEVEAEESAEASPTSCLLLSPAQSISMAC